MDLLDYTSPAYPNSPGHRGIETSVLAAEAIAPTLGSLQNLAFDTIKSAGFSGLTADELAARLRLDRYTIQPRTSELKRKGLIKDGGQRRKNRSGKAAIVWVVCND